MLLPTAGLGLAIDKGGVQITYASKWIGNLNGIPWTIFKSSWMVAMLMLCILVGACLLSYHAGRRSRRRG